MGELNLQHTHLSIDSSQFLTAGDAMGKVGSGSSANVTVTLSSLNLVSGEIIRKIMAQIILEPLNKIVLYSFCVGGMPFLPKQIGFEIGWFLLGNGY